MPVNDYSQIKKDSNSASELPIPSRVLVIVPAAMEL
jgi:hypothetical protein